MVRPRSASDTVLDCVMRMTASATPLGEGNSPALLICAKRFMSIGRDILILCKSLTPLLRRRATLLAALPFFVTHRRQASGSGLESPKISQAQAHEILFELR
jgi:hypothetical protein